MEKDHKKETYDLGDGKLHDPIIGDPAMKGRRWTIDYGYDSGESFDKFQTENMKYSDLLEESIITEAPDKLSFEGHNLKWYEGITFFVFKTPSGKTHVAISSGGKEDFHLQINDMDLSKYVREKLPEFITNLDHENLANVIHYIKPEIMKLNANRKDFLFSGRVWRVGQVSYISIWNDKSVVDGQKEYLNKLMKLLGLSYAKTLFEFPSNQNDYRHYDRIENAPSKSKKETDKFMSQLHTLPPGAKKWAMKGMSLSEALLCEDPDAIDMDGEVLEWADHSVIAVFSIFHNKYSKQNDFILAKMDTGKLKSVYTSDAYVDETINKRPDLLPGEDDTITHWRLLNILVKTGFFEKPTNTDNLREGTELSGRVWSHEGFNYISVWQTLDAVKRNKEMMFRIMDELGIKKNEVLFEVINIPGQLLNCAQVFFEEETKAPTLSPEEITQLLKKQHLDPKAKKVLFMLASNDKYVRVLHRAASKMNVSVAQLKHMMTVGD